jgi:phenylacetate-CoA ligase
MPKSDRNQIEALQLSKLRALVASIVPANPFYTRKLAPGFTAVQSLADFRARFPFTTKHEVVKDRLEHPPYGSNLTFPRARYVRCHQTSGSTAIPIRWLDTAESWAHIVDNWTHILDAAGIRNDDRFLFAFSFGPFLGFWSALEAVTRRGCFCFAGGGMSSVARLQAILDNEITVLCCTPTYAQHLAEAAAQKQIDLRASQVRLIIVAGESGGSVPATRARIESLWPKATVFDHHGMTEVGPVSYQCPSEPGVLHVLDHAYLAEVIDPESCAQVAPHETGELVLTTLDRIGSPLLRYRTGDLVRARPIGVCACGSSEFTLEGGIIGRTDDMVVVRGVNVYPSLIEEIVRSQPDIADYRVHLDSRGPMLELELQVEPEPECVEPAVIPARLAEAIHASLNLRVPIKIVPPGSLPRFEMKARRWVRITEGVPG